MVAIVLRISLKSVETPLRVCSAMRDTSLKALCWEMSIRKHSARRHMLAALL